METSLLQPKIQLVDNAEILCKNIVQVILVALPLMILCLGEAKAQDVTGFNYGTYSSVNAGSLKYGAVSNPFTITYSGGSWNAKDLASFNPVASPTSLSNYVKPANMLELGSFVTLNPAVPPVPVATYTFASPLPATTVMFIQDVDALESFKIEFLDAVGAILDPTAIGTYNLSNPAHSSATLDPTAITVTANDNVNYGESLSDFVINSGLVKQVRITQLASRQDAINYGTAEFYFAAPSPPTADDETSLNNISGSTVSLDLLTGDLLGSGTQASPPLVTVEFTAPAGGTVVGNTITVPGEGEWTYVPASGIITFVPEAGFTGSPTPITYMLTENVTGLTDTAILTITYGPLPVKLASFKVSFSENQVYLAWVTTEETNTDYFHIERSVDGKHWEVIGVKQAFRESQSIVRYEHWDKQPLSGKTYYRLQMVDIDGSFAYSPIRVISRLTTTTQVVYPTPATDRVFLSGLEVSKVKNWSILSVAGFVLQSGNMLQEPQIALKRLDSGLYYLKVNLEDESVYAAKILVAR
jgi:hypothetical protein